MLLSSGLQADAVRDATQAEVAGLKRENERLKHLVGEIFCGENVIKES